MEKTQLSEKNTTLWRIRLTLLACAAAFLCGALFALVPTWIAVSFTAVAAAFYLFFLLWYCPNYRKHAFYTLTEDTIIVEYGVYTHRRFILPYQRILYLSLGKTPAQRLLKLYTVIFWTSGKLVRLVGVTKEQFLSIEQAVKGG